MVEVLGIECVWLTVNTIQCKAGHASIAFNENA